MARWVAIVALLLGVGLTAFESFSAEDGHTTPDTEMTEGGSGFPTPPPY
jgi:hypothetical protein